MQFFAVLLGGRMRPTAELRQALAGRRVVAADGGIAHAAPLGVSPELWVGDFDSAREEDFLAYASVARRVAPADKGATDGELAIEAALSLGARDILLVGALGGPRTDHAFSNLVLAADRAASGIRIAMFDGLEHVHPLGPSPLRLDCGPGRTFSILRFGAVSGLTVRGARWPLEAVDLPFGSVLTQSNESLGPVEASVAEGRALLLMQAG